jgi:hypothetical protein
MVNIGFIFYILSTATFSNFAPSDGVNRVKQKLRNMAGELAPLITIMSISKSQFNENFNFMHFKNA